MTAREIGRVTIAEALELTALVARKQPDRYGRFAARWLCLEEHERATLEEVALLVSNLQSLVSSREHPPALARLRKAVSAHAPNESSTQSRRRLDLACWPG
ncbi:MAG: hypothetical protein ACM3S3_08280 [Candidatus Doudnabacteria bacterium]